MSKTGNSSKRSSKEMDNSDDDDDISPPLLEAEGRRVKEEMPSEDSSDSFLRSRDKLPSSSATKTKTLSELMDEQLLPKDIGRELQTPPARLTRSRITPISLASATSNPSPFMSVVGGNLLRKEYERSSKQGETLLPVKLQRPNKEKSPIPPKRTRPSIRYSSTISTPMNLASENLIQNLLKNQQPTRVDIAVGNGTGSTSSCDKEVDDSSASPPCSSSSTTDDMFSAALANIQFPQKMVNSSTNHGLLLGFMVINAYNTLGKRSSSAQSSFNQELYNLMQKYNVT